MTSKVNAQRGGQHSRADGGSRRDRGRESTSSARARRGQGRPRAPEKEEAILSAALALMAERGYRGMSIPAVAEAAGVGKPTIYLRYPSKFDLALEALARLPVLVDPPDTGSAKADLVAVVRTREEVSKGIGLGILGTVLAEEVEHPELLDRLRSQVVRPLTNQLRAVLQRGIERNEIRADADVDVVVSVINGLPVGRHLLGGPTPRGWAERSVDAVWGALEPKTGAEDNASDRGQVCSNEKNR